MTVKGVLWRFALAYVVAVVVLGYIINYFQIKIGGGMNIAILAGCIMWVCSAFGKVNKRYFTNSEKTAVVIGLVAIDLGLQLLFGWAALSQKNPAAAFGGAMLFITVLVMVLHAGFIYLCVGWAKKPLVKQGIVDG